MSDIRKVGYAPPGAVEAAIEAGAAALWGGRAIDRHGSLDLPRDRCDASGNLALLKPFNVRELLRKAEACANLTEGETKVVHQYPLERAHLVARKSGGYVYLLLAVYR